MQTIKNIGLSVIRFFDEYLAVGIGLGMLWRYSETGHVSHLALIFLGVMTTLAAINVYRRRQGKKNGFGQTS